MKEIDSYGLLGTIIWFLVIAVTFVLLQSLVVGIYAGATYSDLTPEQFEAAMPALETSGTVLSWATIISGVVCSMLVLLAIKFSKNGNIQSYFGLSSVGWSVYAKWGLIFIGVLLLSEAVIYLLGKDSVPDVMVEIYRSANPKWLLWFAIIVMAPIFEEILFRGFLFKGLANSFLGVVGAIIITAAIWGLIHVQYEAFFIALIFVWGLFFGWVRHKTGSVYVTIFLHAVANFVATLQVHLL